MKSIILFVTLSFLASCTVTKRLHSPGWHVEWRGSMNRSVAQENSSTTAANVDQRAENSAESTSSNSQTMHVVEAEQANEQQQ